MYLLKKDRKTENRNPKTQRPKDHDQLWEDLCKLRDRFTSRYIFLNQRATVDPSDVVPTGRYAQLLVTFINRMKEGNALPGQIREQLEEFYANLPLVEGDRQSSYYKRAFDREAYGDDIRNQPGRLTILSPR